VNLKDVKAWDKPAFYRLNVTVRRQLVKNYGPFQELYVSSLIFKPFNESFSFQEAPGGQIKFL